MRRASSLGRPSLEVDAGNKNSLTTTGSISLEVIQGVGEKVSNGGCDVDYQDDDVQCSSDTAVPMIMSSSFTKEIPPDSLSSSPNAMTLAICCVIVVTVVMTTLIVVANVATVKVKNKQQRHHFQLQQQQQQQQQQRQSRGPNSDTRYKRYNE